MEVFIYIPFIFRVRLELLACIPYDSVAALEFSALKGANMATEDPQLHRFLSQYVVDIEDQ